MAQVALSLMLVVTAGVFVRTLQQAARIDPGFDTADIVLANVDVSLAGYRDQTAVDLVQRYHTRIQSVNGVVSVAAARMIPLQGSGFDTVRMGIVDGRGLRATDHGTGARVAVVNESFARAAWPGRPAVGQRFLQQHRGDVDVPVEVVGIAADAKYRYLNDAPGHSCSSPSRSSRSAT